MSSAEIDAELAEWQDRENLIEANLNSFAGLPIFQRLTSGGGRPVSFTGQTQQRIAAAMEVFRELREQQVVLSATLKRARGLRATVSRLMPARHTLDEIAQILNGSSIELQSSPTPPARRELLRDVAQTVRVSPGRFLEVMLDSFRFVRDTLVGLESTEQQNAEVLESLRSELSRVCEKPDPLEPRLSSDLESAQRLHSELSVLAAHDPLAAAERIPGLAVQIKQLAQTVDAFAGNRREIEDRLAESASLMEQLRGLHDRANRSFAERELKIQFPRDASVPLPSGDNAVETLESWLSKLRATVRKGESVPAGIGLKKWMDSAEMLLAKDRRSAEADEAALRARRELRGLFDALQAKAANLGRAEEAGLVALGGEIAQMFSRRPTPLDQVRELVARYQERLV